VNDFAFMTLLLPMAEYTLCALDGAMAEMVRKKGKKAEKRRLSWERAVDGRNEA
jgi:hypothetical protein